MIDGPVSILRADGQPFLDESEEAQNNWKRNFACFLADFLLENGERDCFPAFVIEGFFQSRPVIFDQPKGSFADIHVHVNIPVWPSLTPIRDSVQANEVI